MLKKGNKSKREIANAKESIRRKEKFCTVRILANGYVYMYAEKMRIL